MPEVTVIMSAYSGGKYLYKSIQSVLDQQLTDFELLIVYDELINNLHELLQNFNDPRIKIIQREYIVRTRSSLLCEAAGHWTAFIDSFDIWQPDKLQKQIAFSRENPGHVMIGTFSEIIDKDGHFLYIHKGKAENKNLKKNTALSVPFTRSSIIFSTKLAKELIESDEKAPLNLTDYMLFCKISQYGEIATVAEPLTKCRITPHSLTVKNYPAASSNVLMSIFKRSCIHDKDQPAFNTVFNPEDKTPAHHLAHYHYYLGQVFLFRRFDRVLAIYHLAQAVRIFPRFRKAWIFYIMSMAFPKFLIR